MNGYTVQLTPIDREQPCLYLCMSGGFKTKEHATDLFTMTREQAEAIRMALEYVDASYGCLYNSVRIL